MAKYTNNQWKGNDASISECLDEYGMVYKYDGENFKVWTNTEIGDDGIPTTFQKFSIDNKTIDDYFEDDGEDIARMCGTSQDDMDYEWKLDAMLSYYGASEFVDYDDSGISKDELYEKIVDNWFGVID